MLLFAWFVQIMSESKMQGHFKDYALRHIYRKFTDYKELLNNDLTAVNEFEMDYSK